jgi:hypothetical protein
VALARRRCWAVTTIAVIVVRDWSGWIEIKDSWVTDGYCNGVFRRNVCWMVHWHFYWERTMSDLISREEAIDIVDELFTLGDCYCDRFSVVGALRGLPSAEPEPEEFEWCTDCKEYDQEQHCCHRWSKNIRRTVEELKAQYEHPAKVENVHEEYSSEGICFLTYADCGNCGMQVILGDKFCSECGAKLDWGENDNG